MQVLLPASVGEEMMRQDAPKNVAQLFEIASSSGATTHAGTLLPYSCQLTGQDISYAPATMFQTISSIAEFASAALCGAFTRLEACAQ